MPRSSSSPLSFAAPFAFLAATWAGLSGGGVWPLAAIALTPLVLCGLDHGLGLEPDAAGAPAGWAYRVLPRVYVALQLVILGWAAWRLAHVRPSLIDVAAAAACAGVSAGVFGMLAAHELVHRTGRAERALGLVFLASVGYMHFRIAHLHGHHVRAATLEDPASARRGEGAYAFVARSVAGQLAEAWAFEIRRLRRAGRSPLDPSNRMLRYLAVELAVAGVFAGLGPAAFGFWLAQAAVAILMLELFNYVAHYGLVRLAGERLGPQHSWNVSRRMNNAALFNMGRHSDHHDHPARAYQALEALPDGPQLPTGYAGAILMALVPPLWRAVMHPRLDAAAAGAQAASWSARRSPSPVQRPISESSF
jgi:alkane 1-monooxygenase